jgi:hypothetical protein
MGRSTFEGPILAGDNRFPPFRNVGSADLVQSAGLVLTNTTPNTANYGGSSGQFVTSGQSLINSPGTVFTPSATNPVLTATTIPADTTTLWVRGAAFYLPVGCDINDILIDCGVVPTVTGTLTSATVYVSNNYTNGTPTPTLASTGAISAVGRQSLTAFTGAQLANLFNTPTDIVLPNGQPNVSQVVFTVAIVGTSLTAITAGTFYFTIRYSQADGNIGTATAYPYGNFG